MGRPLWREDDLSYMPLAFASAVFLGSEPLWTRDHILLSKIRNFPFRRLLRLAGSRWRYSNPRPHGYKLNSHFCILLYHLGTDHIENTFFSVVEWRMCWSVFSRLLPSNGLIKSITICSRFMHNFRFFKNRYPSKSRPTVQGSPSFLGKAE
jgi:hypothetical protein